MASGDQRSQEEKLQVYETLFRTSTDSIILITQDGVVVDLNESAAQRLGRIREEIIGSSIFDFIPPGVAARRRVHIEKAHRVRQPVSFEDMRQGKSFEHTIYPIVDLKGDVKRLLLTGHDITKQKLAEAALQQSEAQFAAFMRYLPGAAFLKKRSGEFLFVNETWEHISHMKGSDIYGKTDYDIWPEDIAAQYRANDLEVIAAEVPLQFIQSIPQDEGLRHWITVKFPIFDDNHELIMLGGIAIDITEKEFIEKELQKTERQFKLLVDTMREGAAITDPRGVIKYVNLRTCEMLAYDQNELIGRSAFDFFDFKNLPIAKEEFNKRSHGENSKYEVSLTTKDGRGCPVLMSASPLLSQEGTFEGSFVVMTDLTDWKKAEESLRFGEEILNSLDEGVSLVRAKDLIIVYTNPKLEDMLGYNRHELLGKHVSTINAPQEKMPLDIAEEIRRSLATTHSWRGEVLNLRKDGTTIWCLANVNEFNHREFGQSYLTVQMDITARKKDEEELRHYRDHLEELVARRTEEVSNLNKQLLQSQKLEAVGILAGGVAHEFSNILTAMKGAAYLIQKKLSDDDTLTKHADQIVSSIAKASNLSQGLLSFSRKQTISLRPVHINNAVERICKLLGQFIGEHIELKLHLADREATVLADSHQIEQVLVNLAINAKDAMPEGGIMTIRTDLMQMNEEFIKKHGFGIPGPYVILTVSDTGIGMKEDVRSKIFQPFFTTKSVGKGSGLGLAVTYGIVKQHKGFIDVESIPEQGTTFRIYIPTVDTKATQERSTETLPIRHGYETILLAEDDPEARAVMGESLEMTGYIVLMAGDGEEAVRVFAANKNKIQLVITDVRMPKKNGRVVYEEISRIAPSAKFLFMSGYTADVLDSYGIMKEGLEFISKAASPDELLLKVREILDS